MEFNENIEDFKIFQYIRTTSIEVGNITIFPEYGEVVYEVPITETAAHISKTADEIYRLNIIELIKAVNNLKEFSLAQQMQLINLFK